ncbi:hypothetical protein DRN67_01730 [Candidatus Micrarchaeota archaeon]|nr:MAG: hypothetical protein DRN67_01730 [Candidatus Micrarchaeota archaeon]
MEELYRSKEIVEREKRNTLAQLSALERLENEPAPDLEKTRRHEHRLELMEKLLKIRLDYARSLEFMPLAELLKKMRNEELGVFSFPPISREDAEALSDFLRRSELEAKSASQLLDMTALSPEKLSHLNVDSSGFKREIISRRLFLTQIASLHSTSFLAFNSASSPAVAHLAENSEEARKLAAKLTELERTEEEDTREWERKKRIDSKKAELANIEKTALINSLHELQHLEAILDGKHELVAPQPKAEKDKGAFSSLLNTLKSFIEK